MQHSQRVSVTGCSMKRKTKLQMEISCFSQSQVYYILPFNVVFESCEVA